jgi:hypothetical protein
LGALAQQPAAEQTEAPAPTSKDEPEPETEAAPTPESEPETEDTVLPEDYPAQAACEEMAGLAEQSLTVAASITLNTFDDQSGLAGEGCTVLAATDGRIADVWGGRTATLLGKIAKAGWVSDQYFVGVGIGGLSETYRRDGFVCVYVHQAGPASADLCNEDEKIWDCVNRLPAEDMAYQVTIDCSVDQQTNLSGMGPAFSISNTPVTFSPGSASQTLPGSLPPQGVARFVLAAVEGQTMTVTLTTDPADNAVLSVWGEDEDVYLSGVDLLAEWSMDLPADQDYYIDIKNVSGSEIVYQLTIDILPAE